MIAPDRHEITQLYPSGGMYPLRTEQTIKDPEQFLNEARSSFDSAVKLRVSLVTVSGGTYVSYPIKDVLWHGKPELLGEYYTREKAGKNTAILTRYSLFEDGSVSTAIKTIEVVPYPHNLNPELANWIPRGISIDSILIKSAGLKGSVDLRGGDREICPVFSYVEVSPVSPKVESDSKRNHRFVRRFIGDATEKVVTRIGRRKNYPNLLGEDFVRKFITNNSEDSKNPAGK